MSVPARMGKMQVPSYMTAYEKVLRAAAVGPVYISRSTRLDLRRKTVSWHLARKMERDGAVKRANMSPDWIFLTGGSHYLENVYFDVRDRGPGSPDAQADELVTVLRKLGLDSAKFVPAEQRVGLSIEDWGRLPGMIPRKK